MDVFRIIRKISAAVFPERKTASAAGDGRRHKPWNPLPELPDESRKVSALRFRPRIQKDPGLPAGI